MRSFLILSSLLLTNTLHASVPAQTDMNFQLRDPKTKEVYYTGLEKISQDGKNVKRETLYFDGSKKEVQRDSFQFDSDSLKASSFQSVNTITGEESLLTPKEKGYELSYKAASDKTADKSLVEADSYLASSAADLILANWNTLISGKAVRFSLIIPSRGEVIPFQLVRRESQTVDGESREVFTLMPQNILIRLLAPHLEFQFNKDKKIRTAIFPSPFPIKGSKDKMVEMIFQ